ncbi:unnamed protein product [Soboliphyme baturini]|uniref:RALGAPB_N domain-containing protein n=1 Tax=Soboliphyme baturini TaxID=241478 RepID=A0A183IR01_9BILA|nr:unnamed protein product [Soboliphyme baturini]
MYEDWVEEELKIYSRYVLEIFSTETRLAVTNGVIKELSDFSQSGSSHRLLTDVDVKWCMEILGYALTLPFSAEFDNTIRNAVKIYCEWLTCVFQDGSHRQLPPPLRDQPRFYVPEILGHMHSLFMSRKENGQDGGISRGDHVTQCLFVLNLIYSMSVKTKVEYQPQIFPELLKFLLSINDQLLSHPFGVDVSLATQSLNVLFLVWLQACFSGCFPCPSFWKTLSKYCRRWRQRAPLLEIWITSCIMLTNEMLSQMYGPGYSKLRIGTLDVVSSQLSSVQRINESNESAMILAKDDQLFRKDLQPDVVKQTWYRLFCLLKNPALFFARSDQDMSTNDKESEHREGSDSVVIAVSSSSSLPYCYFRYLFGLNCILNGFLGIAVDCDIKSKEDITKSWQEAQQPSQSSQSASSHAPGSQSGSFHRMTILGRLPTANIKSKEIRASASSSKTSVPNLCDSDVISIILKGLLLKPELNLVLPENRPSVDSLLRLIGDWLFQAAFLDEQRIIAQEDNVSQKSIGSFSSYDSDTLSRNANVSQMEKKEPAVTGFQAAKAEALSGLCRLFCSKRSYEQISERCVARFLQALHLALMQKDHIILSSLIVSSTNLFRINLPFCEALAPSVLSCIDWLLLERDQQNLASRKDIWSEIRDLEIV